jgi:hypothetical protein
MGSHLLAMLVGVEKLLALKGATGLHDAFFFTPD